MENFINQPCYLFIKDLVTFLFTATGLIIAGSGLVTWKKQIKGTKEFEASYALRYSVLKLRDAIKNVRSPWIWPRENQEAIKYARNKYPNIPEKRINRYSRAFVYQMRWDQIREASTATESHLLAAEVLWGSEILDLIKPLHKKIAELGARIQQSLKPDSKIEDFRKILDTIYDKKDERDYFNKEIDEIVKGIMDYIKRLEKGE